MSFLRSLPAETGLLQIFQAFPEAARPLLQYHEVLLRGQSPFSAAERELIAAYVSALNHCDYCHAVHSQTAVALGMSANALARMVGTPRCGVRTSQRDVPNYDPANEDVQVRMRPVLDFVRKLTLTPAKIIAADV